MLSVFFGQIAHVVNEIQRCRAAGVPYRQMGILFRVRVIGEYFAIVSNTPSVTQVFPCCCRSRILFHVRVIGACHLDITLHVFWKRYISSITDDITLHIFWKRHISSITDSFWY